MKNNENILILMLLLTAGVLGAMFLGSYNADKAYADTPDRMGDYIMVTGAVTNSTDLLYVIDVPNKKLLVYHISGVKNQFSIKVADDRVNLANVFRATGRP
jgi:hypothetical protein